uniref:Bestrophin homolog n=1 Tax=Angiostrongylus cantonensis TaxID=6313 RepID=A0A158PCE1_ANGCA
MTVTYSLDVANSSFFCLYRLLFRWKGSIWKSVWAELLVWVILYSLLSILYRLVLTKPQRELFEDLCVFFDTYSSFIPITFMLGFYVSAVFTRWWQIFDNIGWIDTPCLWIAQYVRGSSERARLMRRTLIRYLVLTQAIVFRDVSSAVKKRFPTMNHLVTSGLMTRKELDEFDSIVTTTPKYWVPMNWVFSLVRVAKEEGRIPGEMIYVDLMEVRIYTLCIKNFYLKVVHLAVRCYFAVGIMGRQYLDPDPARQSVAEVLLNPLGEDDDDFECNWILDRNLQVGFNVVDTTYDRFPDMVRDKFWEEAIPEPLYTAESAQRPLNPQVGSCADLITEEDAYMMRPRRRTISHTSHWEGEVENDEVIPVLGTTFYPSSTTSGDSAAFSQSFMSQSRRISDMLKRMQGRRRSSELNRLIFIFLHFLKYIFAIFAFIFNTTTRVSLFWGA